jgi:CDP-glucose 4,6-dehydratase
MFNNIYKNKKVLITGNTGFKGSWLSLWLLQLEANVYGVSNDVPSDPSLFQITDLESKIDHTFLDIRDLDKLTNKIKEIEPDFIFHLAAQPIVKLSYDDPISTMTSNIIGSANVLEALRNSDFKCTVVMITSDKCYENVEWEWGYREHDELGGKDPYSASKGAAEIVIKSYYNSFFSHKESKVKLISVRAGNVIGGADWAANRLVPDMFRAWSRGETVVIRSPYATRPWQHVLEPLSGYLLAGEFLYKHDKLNGLSFNFGPNSNQNKTVLELLNEISKIWDKTSDNEMFSIQNNTTFYEAGLLKLNCDRALHYLNWMPTMDFKETVDFTASWYNTFYNKKSADIFSYTTEQIKEYARIANFKGNQWAK